MSKPKHQMTARLQKKMKKEVRAGAQKAKPIPKSDSIKAVDLLSSFPAKTQKKGRSILKSFEKNLAITKAKKRANHSKRATSATVDEKSPPQIVHVEGQRWIKTLGKQTSAKRKIMTRRMAKKGSK